MGLKSKLNKGCCFYIDVPYGEQRFVQEKSVNKVKFDNKKQLNVLVVDDEQENLNAMSALLTKWGCHFDCFTTVEHTLSFAKQTKAPDIILMDYQLSAELDGVGLIQTLRDIWQHEVAAVLITAVRDDELKLTAKGLNIHYLSKPVKPAKLKALIKHTSR